MVDCIHIFKNDIAQHKEVVEGSLNALKTELILCIKSFEEMIDCPIEKLKENLEGVVNNLVCAIKSIAVLYKDLQISHNSLEEKKEIVKDRSLLALFNAVLSFSKGIFSLTQVVEGGVSQTISTTKDFVSGAFSLGESVVLGITTIKIQEALKFSEHSLKLLERSNKTLETQNKRMSGYLELENLVYNHIKIASELYKNDLQKLVDEVEDLLDKN